MLQREDVCPPKVFDMDVVPDRRTVRRREIRPENFEYIPASRRTNC